MTVVVDKEAVARNEQRQARKHLKGLAETKTAVRASIEVIPKLGLMRRTSKSGKVAEIRYVNIDDLMEELRPRLVAVGLDYTINHLERYKEGGQVVLKFEIVLTAPNGESESSVVFGEGNSTHIAQSYGFKYWCLRTFTIGGGDADDEKAQNYAATPKSKKQKLIDQIRNCWRGLYTQGSQADKTAMFIDDLRHFSEFMDVGPMDNTGLPKFDAWTLKQLGALLAELQSSGKRSARPNVEKEAMADDIPY